MIMEMVMMMLMMTMHWNWSFFYTIINWDDEIYQKVHTNKKEQNVE